eukprot:m.30311 g.30311  ORF g.30311 m.30311 type:complete len:1054 (+) comp8191_c0_seq2:309-3470(+)
MMVDRVPTVDHNVFDGQRASIFDTLIAVLESLSERAEKEGGICAEDVAERIQKPLQDMGREFQSISKLSEAQDRGWLCGFVPVGGEKKLVTANSLRNTVTQLRRLVSQKRKKRRRKKGQNTDSSKHNKPISNGKVKALSTNKDEANDKKMREDVEAFATKVTEDSMTASQDDATICKSDSVSKLSKLESITSLQKEIESPGAGSASDDGVYFPDQLLDTTKNEQQGDHRKNRFVSKKVAAEFFRDVLQQMYMDAKEEEDIRDQLHRAQEFAAERQKSRDIAWEEADNAKKQLEGALKVIQKRDAFVKTLTKTEAEVAELRGYTNAVTASLDHIVNICEQTLFPNSDAMPGNEPSHSGPQYTKRSRWVYILWDVENISIPKDLNPKKGITEGAYKLITRIRDFLEKRGIIVKKPQHGRPQTIESFKVFYRPALSSLSAPTLRDLERADVQLVACASQKPEAVDRLIEQEINRLCRTVTEAHADAVRYRHALQDVLTTLQGTPDPPMYDSDNEDDTNSVDDERGQRPASRVSSIMPDLLGANQSTIVLITSDFDFKAIAKHAYQQGFRIVLIHDAGLSGDRKLAYQRECHAKMFDWRDILQPLLQLKKPQARHGGDVEPLTETEASLIMDVAGDLCSVDHAISREDLVKDMLAVLQSSSADGTIQKHSAAMAIMQSDSHESVGVALDLNDISTASKTLKQYLRRAERAGYVSISDQEGLGLMVKLGDSFPKEKITYTEASQVVSSSKRRLLSSVSSIQSINLYDGPNSVDITLDDDEDDEELERNAIVVPADIRGISSEQDRDDLLTVKLSTSPLQPLHSPSSEVTYSTEYSPRPRRQTNGMLDFDFSLMANHRMTPTSVFSDDGSAKTSSPPESNLKTYFVCIVKKIMTTVIATGGYGTYLSVDDSTLTKRRSTTWSTLEAPGSKDCKLKAWKDTKVKVTGYEVVDPPFPESTYVVFVVLVTAKGGRKWEVRRRYSEFSQLHMALAKCKFSTPLVPMPPKRFMKTSKDTCEERVRGFQAIFDHCQELTEDEGVPLLAFLSYTETNDEYDPGEIY